MNLIIGLGFGVLVGSLMRAPGAQYLVAANAVNLSVMASLWLGISLAPNQERRVTSTETAGAFASFIMVALVFQHHPNWLYIGFAFQTAWCAAHIGGRFGVRAQSWFPGFAAMANLGFIAAFYLMNRVL